MVESRIFKQVPRLLFGSGGIKRLDDLLPRKEKGSDYYIFVVDDALRLFNIIDQFRSDETDLIEWFPASVREPSTTQVDTLKDKVLSARKGVRPKAVVGVGGGSTMDVSKALSVVLTNDGSASAYQGWDLVHAPGVYKVGIPTVSGSGAEASRTAVLMGKDRKFGINSDYSMFDAVILDSSLIGSVPSEQRFYSGMDCFIHCVESLQGTMINELARGYASKGLELCEKVFLDDGTDDMLMTASYMGGVSIVNSEVGVCHALSYGLSLELGLRHGLANCIVFDILDEYYRPWVQRFRSMCARHNINLPKNVCGDLGDRALERMVDMTLRMERPLTNALGIDWKQVMTPKIILDLYSRM